MMTTRDAATVGRMRFFLGDVRDRVVATRAWDEEGHEERYQEAKLVKAMPANRNLGFLMQLWAVGIGIQ